MRGRCGHFFWPRPSAHPHFRCPLFPHIRRQGIDQRGDNPSEQQSITSDLMRRQKLCGCAYQRMTSSPAGIITCGDAILTINAGDRREQQYATTKIISHRIVFHKEPGISAPEKHPWDWCHAPYPILSASDRKNQYREKFRRY